MRKFSLPKLISCSAAYLAAILVAAPAPAASAQVDLIPPDRRIDWKPGIPGGIPENYVKFCNVKEVIPGSELRAIGDGVADDTAALQAALNLCPNGGYVFLPEGVYRVSAELFVKAIYNFDGVNRPRSIAIRGAGPKRTRIVSSANTPSIITFAPGIGLGASATPITGGATKGSTLISVANSGPFRSDPDSYVLITMPNDLQLIAVAPYMTDAVGQIVRCTTVSEGKLSLARPLYSSLYPVNGVLPVVSRIYSPIFRCGVEDLAVERTANAGQHNIRFLAGLECWVRRVESVRAAKWHIRFETSANCEVRECYVSDTWNGGGDTGYGVGLFNRCTDILVEDNIFRRCRHSIITEYGGQGNVFGYNYSLDPINENQDSTDFLMFDACHHGGDPRFNLWEGNVVAKIGFDNVLGSSRHNTAFRNWAQRKSLPSVQVGLSAVEIQRNGLSNNVIGNVFCIPGQAANTYSWTNNSFASIRRFGYSSSGDINHQGVDLRVFETTLYHLNFDYVHNETWRDLKQGVETLPPSLYLQAKPAFFRDLPWPPIGPDLSEKVNLIPAQVRWGSLTTPPKRPAGLRAVSQSP
jgi:hypothetical protein